ncbi:MAG: alpha/beta fold hydrolase [Lachnospiraceae bacterium]|nr:alpha/beta fold hydrolase [Lachnospiraceae bacterium]
MITKEDVCISDYDGLKLSVFSTAPEKEEEIRGVVQISHGMCENKERYEELMRYLTAQGYVCVIHDHRGHGKSIKAPEDLGYMYGGGAEAMVSDLYQITKGLKKSYPGKPLILLGHSMGTLAARTYLKQHDTAINALILTGSPSRNSALPIGKIIAGIQKRLQGGKHRSILLQTLSFGPYVAKFPNEKSKSAWCCSDPEVVKAYDNSPLCGFPFTVDGYLTLFEMMEETYNSKGWNCRNLELPILFLSGREDPCLESTKKFGQAVSHLRKLGYRNVQGKLYPGMRHEILNEREKEKVYKDILRFINAG